MTEQNKQLVMIGADGHAKVCYDVAKTMGKWNEIIILDDNQINNYFQVKGSIKEFEIYINNSGFYSNWK